VAKLSPSRIRSTVVDDRRGGIAGPHEIGVQRVHRPVGCIDRALRGHQRLADHLAAEDPLPADLRAGAAEQVLFERLDDRGLLSSCCMAVGAVRDILVFSQRWARRMTMRYTGAV
jgi:hypothetical protein